MHDAAVQGLAVGTQHIGPLGIVGEHEVPQLGVEEVGDHQLEQPAPVTDVVVQRTAVHAEGGRRPPAW